MNFQRDRMFNNLFDWPSHKRKGHLTNTHRTNNNSMQHLVEFYFIYLFFFFFSYTCDVMHFLIIYGLILNRTQLTMIKHVVWAWKKSASQSDNAAFRGDDDDNSKEEEVYQDLCAIQSSIASRRDQVFTISRI